MKRNLFRSLFNDQSDASEERTKFIRKRIEIVQKYIPDLNAAMSQYINKNSDLIDTGEKIASIMDNYAKSECVTTEMKERLSEFAGIVTEINGKRSKQIKSMEENILQELSEYGKLCKNVRSELKSMIIASDKERIRLRQLRKAQEHLVDHQQIFIAESELVKARSESAKSSKSLEEQIDIFERRRLNGLREVLLSWSIAELRFHAKALELFTDAYKIAANINVESDIQEFRNKLRIESTPRSDSNRETSFQRSDSLMQLLRMPFNRSRDRLTGIGIPHPLQSGIPAATEANQSCMF